MKTIRWIHFSDLHLGDDSAVETRLMRRNLPSYVARLNQSFDYAFCTGDIKNWSADYSSATDYLKKLCAAAHTPLDRLFIVPGNHDMKICATGDSERDRLIDKLTDWNTDYYTSANGVISTEDINILRSGESDFQQFVKILLGSDRADKYASPHFVITTEYFNILHVDSTLTYKKDRDRDFILGTRLLMDALDACDESLPIILLTHYSFDFLEQHERNVVEKLLDNYHVQLWLAGHEHENLIRKQRDKFIECQCGNLALQKGARSCFITCEYDADTGEGFFTVHAWYPENGWERYPFARRGFDDNTIYPFALRLPGADRSENVSVEMFNAREAFEGLSAAGNIFSGVRINQGILTDLEWNGQLFKNDGQTSPLDVIIGKLWSDKEANFENSCNALVLGDGGMGKSTAMYHACGRLLKKQRLALYISLQARESSSNESIVDFILRMLYKNVDEKTKNKFIQLTASRHAYPDIVLFIDGFNELSGEGAQRYVAEIKELAQYAGVQIIISSRLDFLRDYGLSHFSMIRTSELREEQIQRLFIDRPLDWNNVLAQKNLQILLKNPMMALLYARTCPIVEKNTDLDYLEWIMPITNASDLLHDYYMAQIALLLKRRSVDGHHVLNCLIAVDRLLPALAYEAERLNTTVWDESDFYRKLSFAVKDFNHCYFNNSSIDLPEKIRKVMRRFRLHQNSIHEDDLYDLIISELCLLRSGNGRVSFAHQIFRDYLAAVYFHHALIENFSVNSLWHSEEIHKGVVQYLRYIGNESPWGSNGTVSQMLLPYRDKEADKKDWFIVNIINCWLSVGDGERDLSGLDLRKVSLTDHLKIQFSGTINIDNAWLSKETLINDKRHDEIVGICFSHDNRTMAVVSQNGIVSVTNLITKSQMIVGEIGQCEKSSTEIGFDADDYLIISNGKETWKWPTIAYDKAVACDVQDILRLDTADENIKNQIETLQNELKASDLYGVYRVTSENGWYLAVGFNSGFIQVWDVMSKDCIADLSLSDAQIATAAFTKDGKIAALGSGGKLVQIWDINEEKCEKILFFDQRVSKLRLPGDGKNLECQFADGTYKKVNLKTNEIGNTKKPDNKPFISHSLRSEIKTMDVTEIQSAANGNAIVLTSKGQAYTWDEKLKKLNFCSGHNSNVTAIAICSSDNRFAASYSPEKYIADRYDRNRRKKLNNQKLVRVRIVKTGQCQWRLPTNGRSIRKLQFFTSNRIILAGYATNGDILLWELINEQTPKGERGRWETVEIVKNNEAEPLECAFPSNKKNFISAYTDGSIIIRPFSNDGNRRKIYTLPGIDASVFRWNKVQCCDELKEMLEGYRH